MQVGEIRPATVDDFKQLLDIVLNNEDWEAKPDKGGVCVWTKSNPTSPVKMIKLAVDFDDITALTLYDVLHDPNFRPVWDESMIEGLDIYKIDDYNDIGYYSLRCPPPLKNRDFVNQRSWGIYGDDHMIMNHTIDIEEMPVKKNFVRGVSYLTGYVVRDLGTAGCSVYYITQNDPGGQVPKWILNRISSVIAPKVLDKIHTAALKYEEWKSKNNPEWRPWRGIGKDDKPYWPRLPKHCTSSNSTPNLELQKNNGVNQQNGALVQDEGEVLHGSLDSLAPPPTDIPKAEGQPPQPDQEIIAANPPQISLWQHFTTACHAISHYPASGNVFNVPETVKTECEDDMKPPLLRHESISLRLPNEDDNVSSHSGTLSRQSSFDPQQPKRGLLMNAKSFDSSEHKEQRTLYHSNSMDKSPRGTLQHTDSVDTGHLSDLCHSISQLTTGDERPGSERHVGREDKRRRDKQLNINSEAFASVTMSSHPIDPDCCTRVSRHTLGNYGNSKWNKPSTERGERSNLDHPTQIHTEASKYKVKKTRNSGEEGLESASLKFFSKMSSSSKNKNKEKLRIRKQLNIPSSTSSRIFKGSNSRNKEV